LIKNCVWTLEDWLSKSSDPTNIKHNRKIQKLSYTLGSLGSRAQRTEIFLRKIEIAAISWSLASAKTSFRLYKLFGWLNIKCNWVLVANESKELEVFPEKDSVTRTKYGAQLLDFPVVFYVYSSRNVVKLERNPRFRLPDIRIWKQLSFSEENF
jgi:hypothetical protein